MTKEKSITLLGGWEGYELGTADRVEVGEEPGSATPEVWLELVPRRDRLKRCSGCGEQVAEVHDHEERWVRDLAILDTPTWLCVDRCRVKCPRCGPKLEELSWLARYARANKQLAEHDWDGADRDAVCRRCGTQRGRHAVPLAGATFKILLDLANAQARANGPRHLDGYPTRCVHCGARAWVDGHEAWEAARCYDAAPVVSARGSLGCAY